MVFTLFIFGFSYSHLYVNTLTYVFYPANIFISKKITEIVST